MFDKKVVEWMNASSVFDNLMFDQAREVKQVRLLKLAQRYLQAWWIAFRYWMSSDGMLIMKAMIDSDPSSNTIIIVTEVNR